VSIPHAGFCYDRTAALNTHVVVLVDSPPGIACTGALSGGRITVTAHGASLALPAILAGTRAWMDSR
jgi:hypothetical protein